MKKEVINKRKSKLLWRINNEVNIMECKWT